MSDEQNNKGTPPPAPPPGRAKRRLRLRSGSQAEPQPSSPPSPGLTSPAPRSAEAHQADPSVQGGSGNASSSETAGPATRPSKQAHKQFKATMNYGEDKLSASTTSTSETSPVPRSTSPFRSTAPLPAGQQSLAEFIARGEADPDHIVDLLCRICDAVQKLHGGGQNHGRLTPRHVILLKGVRGPVELRSADEVELDHAYDVLYEAPEAGGILQVRKRRPVLEDVYALGTIGFEMATGSPPVQGASIEEIRSKRAKFPVPALRQVAADVAVVPAVELQLQKALKQRVVDRHPDAGALAAALRSANAADDRATMIAMPDDQAALLKQMLAAHQSEEDARLEQQQRELDRQREELAQAQERARSAELEADRLKEMASARRSEAGSARGGAGVWIASLALVALLAGGAGWWWTHRSTAPDPGEPSPQDAGAVAPPSAEDAGQADSQGVDTGAQDSGAPDTVQDVGQDTADTQVTDTGADAEEVAKDVLKAPKPRKKPRPRPRKKTVTNKPKKVKTKPGAPVVF